MQWPDAQDIVNPPFVLCQCEQVHKNRACNRTNRQCANRVHQVRASAHGYQPCQRPVVQEAWVIFT